MAIAPTTVKEVYDSFEASFQDKSIIPVELEFEWLKKAVARYSIAVDRRYKDQNGNYPTDFFNLTSFGNTASFVEKYLRKGTKIVVEGELRNNNYEKDGKTVYSDQIIANSVEFAESKNAQGGGDYSNAPSNAPTGDAGDGFNAGIAFALLKEGITRDMVEGGLEGAQWDSLVRHAGEFSADCCCSLENYVSREFGSKMAVTLEK